MPELTFDDATRRKLKALRLSIRRAFSGEGGAAVRARGLGSGFEFHDHRAYSPGDDVRDLDWHLFGRLGDLYVKRFRDEADLEFQVVLDRSASMTVGAPSKDTCARRLAAAMAACFTQGRRPLEVRLAEKNLPRVGPQVRGESDFEVLLGALENLPMPSSRADFSGLPALLQSRRSRIVVLFSDLYDEPDPMPLWSAAKSSACDLLITQISADVERRPPFDGSVVVEGMEGEGQVMVPCDQEVLDRYAQLFRERLEAQERLARGRGMKFCSRPAEEALEEGIFQLALEGGLLR